LTGATDHGKGCAEILGRNAPEAQGPDKICCPKAVKRKERNVAKPEWGSKRTCPKCGTRFYDLQKDDPVVCIDCGTSWNPEPVLKAKQPIVMEEKAAKVVDEDEEDVEDEDIELDDDDDDMLGDVSLDDDDDEEVSGMVDTSLSDDEN
jgi:hypothetical protein